MCGLFGAATRTPIKLLPQVLTQLALYNEERGRHSWGAYNGEKFIKHLGPIGEGLFNIPFQEKGLLLAHTRAATVGKISVPNCHPWEFTMKNGSKVIGAHNGSVYNYGELNKKYELDLEVDSMHIFKALADERSLKEIEGYGAIVFLKEDVLHFGRFNGGVLSIAQIEGAGLIWSSDEVALKKALKGADLPHFMYTVTPGRYYYYTKDQLWDSDEKIDIQSAATRYAQRSSNFQGSQSYGNGSWCRNDSGYGAHQQRSFGQQSGNVNKRTIRLRIVRSVTPPNPIIDNTHSASSNDASNACMTAIFSDENVSILVKDFVPCHKCTQETCRQLLSGEPTCLPCVASMVLAGEIVTTAYEVGKPDEILS